MSSLIHVDSVSGSELPLDEVVELIDASSRADGVEPLGEQPLRALKAQSSEVTHLIGRVDGRVAGYAQLDRAGDPVAELAVHPRSRRQGCGYQLLERLRQSAPSVAVWAHGDLPAARGLAQAAGMERTRELLRMRRDSMEATEIGAVNPPSGVDLGSVAEANDRWPGLDVVGGILHVNNAAFSWHPEQGGWTRAQLEERLSMDWVDPAGIFIAVSEAAGQPEVVGFHWTKVHPVKPGEPQQGEVYVVGVDPSAQGTGLGSVLTRLGVAYLEAIGMSSVILYVEGDNLPARRTYDRLCFNVNSVDVTYS